MTPMLPQRDGSYLAPNGYSAQRESHLPLTKLPFEGWFLRDACGQVVDHCSYLSDLLRRNGYRLSEAWE